MKPMDLTDEQLLLLESESRIWGHEGVAIMARRALNGDSVAREACGEIWAREEAALQAASSGGAA